MYQYKYVVVIPAKNEEDNIRATLDSVVNQTIQPEYCLVVDDGSTDTTQEIVVGFQQQHHFIGIVTRSNQHNASYSLGGHVVRAFEFGRTHIESTGIPYDYIVKLDADLRFESNHVEQIFSKFSNSPDENWGIASGTPYIVVGEKKYFNYSPSWHSQGQFKFYHREFLQQLGQLPQSLGWDCADNIEAISRGWKTAAFKDIHYQMFRDVGGKFNLTRGRSKHGVGSYVLGYHPLYFSLRVVHDVFKRPFFSGALSMLSGYISAMFQRKEKLMNPEKRKLLRQLLWEDLLRRFKNREFDMQQKLRKNLN